MAQTLQNIQHAKENATLASYGWGIFSKGKRFTYAMGYLYRDVAKLSDSRITRLFMQLQAGVSIGGTSATHAPIFHLGDTCSASPYAFANISRTFKENVNYFTKHPISTFARSFCFYKQTLDFGIAGYQCANGSRSAKSLFHHGVNTTLAYIPILTASLQVGETLPAQLAINAITIGCLAYSIRQDIIHSSNPGSRESSPSVGLVKQYVVPPVQGFASRLWG